MHRTPTATVPASNSRVLIITALITASTTVGVAFIGIFPQMRNSDAQRYGQLQQEFADFRQKAGAITAGVIVPSEKKMAVSGTVFTGPDRRQTRNGVEVYLFPGGSGGLTAKTDDNGRFTLNGVPDGVYSIIVRDATGKSGIGLLDDSADEVTVIGALIKYHFK